MPPSNVLTGPASPRCTVCAPGAMPVATDAQAVNGVLYNGNTARRKAANDVYSDVNEASDDD